MRQQHQKSLLYSSLQLQSFVLSRWKEQTWWQSEGSLSLSACSRYQTQQARQTPSINCLLIKVFKVHLCQEGSKETLNHGNNYSLGPGQWNWFIIFCSSDAVCLCTQKMSINLWLWSFHSSPDSWHILSPFQFVGSLSYVKVRRKGVCRSSWGAVGQTGRRETASDFSVVSELCISSQL